MNIICSVIVYHGRTVENCLQIFTYLMNQCNFRAALTNNFQLVHLLSEYLEECLKQKCHDIYFHIVKKYFILDPRKKHKFSAFYGGMGGINAGQHCSTRKHASRNNNVHETRMERSHKSYSDLFDLLTG